MKLTLSHEELAELIRAALAEQGFSGATDVELDLGEGNTLPLDLVQGLIVNLGAK